MSKEAVTIRFPSDLLKKAKQLKEAGESFNQLVIESLEREVKRRKSITTHHRILARKQQSQTFTFWCVNLVRSPILDFFHDWVERINTLEKTAQFD